MKHALIIGASGDIGKAISRRLQGDYALTVVGRNTQALSSLKAEAVNPIPTDISSELEVEALFESLPAIDLLVYSAGDIQPELIKMAAAEHWRRVMDANLTGVFYTLKYAEAKLNKEARVYVIGARPELVSYRGFAAYAASKAGLKALLEIAAIEMKRKASFTLVLPKAVDTQFWDKVGKAPADALKADDVAKAIVSNLAEEASSELRVG